MSSRKMPLGKDARHAGRQFDKIAAELGQGTYVAPQRVRFHDFAESWLAGLRRKQTTRDSYRCTINYANKVFGDKYVHDLSTLHMTKFAVFLSEQIVVPAKKDRPARRMSASTQAKHLRVVHACLTNAVAKGYAGRHPGGPPKDERPSHEKVEAAFFSSDELARLLAEFPEGVYRVLFEVALKTGMRQGELLALTWGDVDLTGKVIHVRRSYTDGHLSTPKNHEKREVDITPDVVELLGRWWGECESPDDDRLVFPGDTKSGYVNAQTLRRRKLYAAMERAGVPRVGTFRGASPAQRTWHSLRHTFAKIAIQNGAQLTWLQRHMGHSSLNVTIGIYGHFGAEARRKEADKLVEAFAGLSVSPA